MWFVVVSEKPDSGGLHKSSRMTVDMLHDPGLAKDRKFIFTTNHKARPPPNFPDERGSWDYRSVW